MNIKKYLEGKIITEAEYKGRKVSLNKPFRTPGGPKKFSVYVKNEKGNVVKVNFGDPNMRIKRNSPERRKSFRARHNCDNPGPKTKARYWSCQAGWNKTKSVKDLIKEEILRQLNENYNHEEELQEGWRDNITKVLAGLSLITTLNTGISFAKGGEKDKAVKEYISKKFTGNIEDVAGYTKGGYPVYKKDSPSAKEFKSKYNNAIENNIPSFEYNGFTYQVNNNSREKLDILGIAQLGFKTDLRGPEISNKRYDVPAVKSVAEPETGGKNIDNSKSTNISTFKKEKIYDLSAEIKNNIRNSDNEWFELPDAFFKYLKSNGKEIQANYGVKGLRDTKTDKIYLALPKTKEGINSYVQIFKKYILPKMKGIEAVKTLDGKVISVQEFLGSQLNELLLFNKDARKKGFEAEQEKYKDNPNAIHYKAEPVEPAKFQPKTNSRYDIQTSKK